MAARTRATVAAALALAAASTVACGPPEERPPPSVAKKIACPPPPEPDHLAVVVGTIGELHLAESNYPLSRLGDVLATFKPDLVLVGARVDAFRDERLEDAPFEMTYVSYLARQHGAAVEPIDWYQEKDRDAPAAAFDPWDAAEIAKREAAVLSEPRTFTFEQANGDALERRVFAATNAEARHRGGDPLASRRRAWIQHLATSAVDRHERPKRVLAYVDVFDRPAIDLALRADGYSSKSPVEVVDKAKEVMVADVPPAVIDQYKAQLARVREKAAKASGADKARWEGKQRVLEVAVDKRAQCCVSQAALAPPK